MQIQALQEAFQLKIQNYEDGVCPFKITREKGSLFLQSRIFKIKMSSFKKKIELYDKSIFFTKKFSEMCDIILLGLSLKLPIILEGESGQGKQTAIHYMSQKLGLAIINIVISKSTKVDDLLMKIIIEKSNIGEILVKNQETELFKAIKSTEEHPKKLIVFQGINNASPAVLEVLNSIFNPDSNILLSNGSILEKGKMNIIGIFNKGRDNINRDKIPEGILFNCIYYLVDNPSSIDILNIISNLFAKMDFGKEENIKYVKNYLIENRINGIKNEIEATEQIKDKKYFEDYFQKAKELESEDFAKKFLDAILFSLETTNESPFSLNDIKKYIDFRESVPQINYLLIQLFIFAYHFSQEENINKISEKLDLLRNIEFLPTIDYDEDKKHIIIKLEREAKESIRVKVKNPEKIKIKKCKKLFDTLTKSQKHCFIFLICCIISKKTPIIQGPTASGKSYLLNVVSILLGQDSNLYQMNLNTGMSILTGQEIIKEDFNEKEREEINKCYKSIKNIIDYEKPFNSMSLKHYKKVISKIDKKLENSDDLDEETKEKLKKARRTIFIIISPLSRFIHKDSVFSDSICKNKGQWVILDGIEMAPLEIPEKIVPLCGENPEINIFESGKGIYITSNDIKENFHLFIIYNPFNKGSKHLDQVLFNKCVSFTLPSIDISQQDASTIIYNSIKISKKANKNIWNMLSSKLAASHMTATKVSENHLEQMAGGIQITTRNLNFLITDRNKNDFDDSNLDEIMRWIKSSLNFYYFNSFIDAQKNKKEESKKAYTKVDFKNEIYNSFKKTNNLIITSNNYMSEEDMFPEIVKNLKEIQISSSNEASQFKFNFGEFVKACLEVPIQKSNLEYICNQIEDTINLLNISCLSNEFLYSFYQIKIILKFFNELLENIGEIKTEYKGQKINSDDLLNIKSLINIRPILLKLRLLEGLTNKRKVYFGYYMNPVLYMPEINNLLLQLNELVLYRDKKSLKNFFSWCKEYHNYINFIEFIFPYNKFIENCKGSDFDLAYFYIEFMIEYYKNKTNFILIFDDEEIPFIFEKNQYNRFFPILKLNEEDNIFLSIDTSIKYYKPNSWIMLEVKIVNNIENVNKQKTTYFINLLKNNSGIVDINIFQSIFYSYNNENVENIPSKKFLTSNLFLINNSIIPKIWTFLFSFDEDSEVLNYIINNLLPFEREIYNIVKNNFYSNLNDKSDIEKCLEFTEKLHFLYNEESFLWRDLIGKKLEKNLRDEDYKNYFNKIEEEKLNLDILKDYCWPEKSINDFKLLLEEQSKEIYNKMEPEQKGLELKKAKDKLLNLKSKILKLKLIGGLQIFKIYIINKIENLIKDKLKVILEKTKEIEQEIEDLIFISKEESISILGNDLDWGSPKLKYKMSYSSKTIKLYKNMLFYSVCNELVNKIMNSKDNKERYRYGKEIGNLGLESILKFIKIY